MREMQRHRLEHTMQNGAARTLEDGLQYEAPEHFRGNLPVSMFYLQICTFLSGAEGS